MEPTAARVIDRAGFGGIFPLLARAGYQVIGPTIRDGAIRYGEVAADADLPGGWTERQDGGTYRLERRADAALFGYAVGPDSLKRYLFPPRSRLVDVSLDHGRLDLTEPELPGVRYAFLGVRACELAAVAIQDRVFLESGAVDRIYAHHRRGAFMIGVNCAVAGGTCFCASMGTGPECTAGYDLVLTELVDGSRHDFVVVAGSDDGMAILEEWGGRPATVADHAAVRRIVAAASTSMGRTLDTDGLPKLLRDHPNHPRWEAVAARCLACTNCTLVCPTCFCSTTEDAASLDRKTATRDRRWDSCFALDFSAIHGVPVRSSTRSRYRQWMTHKLSTWHDQFGTSGCVGCGRCITWCPVGIDITEEATAMQTEAGAMQTEVLA